DGARQAAVAGNALILVLAIVPLHQLVAGAGVAIAETTVAADPPPPLDPAHPFPMPSPNGVAAALFEAAVFHPGRHPEQVTCQQTDSEKTHGMTPILIVGALAANSTDFITPALH
ncbi:MAG: hypothetical protein ACREEJ_05010, partial [Ensifer adhaerens]